MTDRTIDTPGAIISWDERGFVRIECKPGVSLDTEDVKAFNKARKVVSPVKKHLCLFIIRQFVSISRESRVYASGSESSEITQACANIIDSPLGKVMGNIFIRVHKPPYPAKLFNDEEEAIKWLLQFKE